MNEQEMFKTAEQCEEAQHKIDCKNGKHKFVPCDELEPTCIYCGKFQS